MVAPLKPADIARALQRGTQAELDEYERLVSERFETDPSQARPATAESEGRKLERLQELARKLFG